MFRFLIFLLLALALVSVNFAKPKRNRVKHRNAQRISPKLEFLKGLHDHTKKMQSQNNQSGCELAKQTGLQLIWPPAASNSTPFYALCLKLGRIPEDPKIVLNPPAWTMVLHRTGNKTDFYRNWHMYEKGFGNIAGDHWIGLRRLHEVNFVDLSQLYEA